MKYHCVLTDRADSSKIFVKRKISHVQQKFHREKLKLVFQILHCYFPPKNFKECIYSWFIIPRFNRMRIVNCIYYKYEAHSSYILRNVGRHFSNYLLPHWITVLYVLSNGKLIFWYLDRNPTIGFANVDSCFHAELCWNKFDFTRIQVIKSNYRTGCTTVFRFYKNSCNLYSDILQKSNKFLFIYISDH